MTFCFCVLDLQRRHPLIDIRLRQYQSVIGANVLMGCILRKPLRTKLTSIYIILSVLSPRFEAFHQIFFSRMIVEEKNIFNVKIEIKKWALLNYSKFIFIQVLVAQKFSIEYMIDYWLNASKIMKKNVRSYNIWYIYFRLIWDRPSIVANPTTAFYFVSTSNLSRLYFEFLFAVLIFWLQFWNLNCISETAALFPMPIDIITIWKNKIQKIIVVRWSEILTVNVSIG